MEVLVMDAVNIINGGFTMAEVPSATHQSALRIRMKTSPRKFVLANPDLHGEALCKAWMKQLFVGRGDDSTASRFKAQLIGYMESIKPDEPMDGFLRLDLVVTYAWLKKHKKNDQYEYILKNTRPDIDNVAKIIMDAMDKSGLVRDDARFCRVVLEKRFGHKPGIRFRISRMSSSKLKEIAEKACPFA
jgi:Holliday junction resolvase RusA-like endonuclease